MRLPSQVPGADHGRARGHIQEPAPGRDLLLSNIAAQFMNRHVRPVIEIDIPGTMAFYSYWASLGVSSQRNGPPGSSSLDDNILVAMVLSASWADNRLIKAILLVGALVSYGGI